MSAKMTKVKGLKSLTVLHAGSGPKAAHLLPNIFNGWKEIRLDINPDAKPDIVSSISDMPKVKSKSVDAVFSAHCLEHLMCYDVPKALKEFKRVLKPDGFIMIVVPDLQSIGDVIAQGRLAQPLYETPYTKMRGQPVTALDMLFGYRPDLKDNPHMIHKMGFTTPSLAQEFAEAGFMSALFERRSYNLLGMAVIQSRAEKRMQEMQKSLRTLAF